jgi:hypothetical protein
MLFVTEMRCVFCQGGGLVDEDSAFTEYGATSLGKVIRTFRDITVSSSSRVPADGASCIRGVVTLRGLGTQRGQQLCP